MDNEVLRSVVQAKILYAGKNDFGINLKVKKTKDMTEDELFC